MGEERNSNPIQIVFNYWEVRPTLVGARLDDLIRSGITHVASFVPWQAVESDISHTLARYLQAASDRKLAVSLILSPELGVSYANSGLPKDILSRAENVAKYTDGSPVSVHLPPNSFYLPSLSAPEFPKRYTFHNFLSRLDALLADLAKTQPHLLERVTAVLTGCFWKYYRPMQAIPSQAYGQTFGGVAGDYSSSSAVAYRQRLEQFFSQREFIEAGPTAANRWKTRGLEDVNRKWFFQYSEDVFRSRSTQFVRKKAIDLKVQQLELFTPEADPTLTYSNFLQVVSGKNGDFARLSKLVDAAATRASRVADASPSDPVTPTHPFIHWSELGGFRTLSDSEKQFLILKSLLLMGGRGGGILIDENEWFSLSGAFRSRAESLARMLSQKELTLKNSALYLAPHLWSASGVLWEELATRLGPNARMVASVDLVLRDREAKLVVVDPSMILTQEIVHKLLGWAKSGRMVVMPRSPLYTDAARTALEGAFADEGKAMEINLGISYALKNLGEGKLIVYNLPEGIAMSGELLGAWQKFLSAIFSVAGVQNPCNVSDTRLSLIQMDKHDGTTGVFILNGSSRSVAADLLFHGEVSVSDLMLSSPYSASAPFGSPSANAAPSGPAPGSVPASRFALEVPPCGVLPIAVDGLGDAEERRAAAVISDTLRGHVHQSANNELPGFDGGEDISTLWN